MVSPSTPCFVVRYFSLSHTLSWPLPRCSTHPQITPVCPHTLSFRPVVLPESLCIKLRIPVDSRTPCCATMDGREPIPLNAGDYVHIVRSSYPVPTINLPSPLSSDLLWFGAIETKLNFNVRASHHGTHSHLHRALSRTALSSAPRSSAHTRSGSPSSRPDELPARPPPVSRPTSMIIAEEPQLPTWPAEASTSPAASPSASPSAEDQAFEDAMFRHAHLPNAPAPLPASTTRRRDFGHQVLVVTPHGQATRSAPPSPRL